MFVQIDLDDDTQPNKDDDDIEEVILSDAV